MSALCIEWVLGGGAIYVFQTNQIEASIVTTNPTVAVQQQVRMFHIC